MQAKISIGPRWNVLLILLLSFFFSLNPDKSWAGFPDIGLGARPMGMGGAFVAVADDANSIFWNPAGISQIQRVELSSMYFNPYGLNVNSQLLSGAFRHPFDGGIGMAILRTGEIDFYEEQTLILALGQDISSFTSTEISIGINLKNFQQSMPNYDLKDPFFAKGNNSWNHRAYDAGFLWHAHSLIDIGGMAANIVADDKNIAPLYRVGCTVFPRKIVSIAFEGTQRHRSGSFVQQSLRIGSEYKPIVTRTGYLYKAAIRSGGRLTLSQGNQAYIGGGLEFALSDQIMARLDYALSLPLGGMNAELGNTHRVSFSCALKSTSNYQKKILSLKRKLCQNSEQWEVRETVSSLYEKWLAEGIRDPIQATRVKKQKDAWQKLKNGIDFYMSGQYQSTITELGKGMELDANLAELYKIRALVYWKLEDLDLAKSDLDKANSIEPLTQIKGFRFLIELIVSNEKSKFQQQYKDLFKRAARSSARGEFEMAIANWKTSLLCSITNESIIRRQVTEAYEKWLDPKNGLIDTLDPGSLTQIRNQQVAWEYLTKGLSNFKETKNYNQARANFEECLKLDPDLTEAHKWLGTCHAMTQNEETAKSEFRLFLMTEDAEKLPFFKFYVSSAYEMDLSKEKISPNLRKVFKDNGIQLAANTKVLRGNEGVWMIVDRRNQRAYTCLRLSTQIVVYSGFIPTIDSLPTEAREIFSQMIMPGSNQNSIFARSIVAGEYENEPE